MACFMQFHAVTLDPSPPPLRFPQPASPCAVRHIPRHQERNMSRGTRAFSGVNFSTSDALCKRTSAPNEPLRFLCRVKCKIKE